MVRRTGGEGDKQLRDFAICRAFSDTGDGTRGEGERLHLYRLSPAKCIQDIEDDERHTVCPSHTGFLHLVMVISVHASGVLTRA